MELDTTTIGEHCKYRKLENGIHEFIMTESSRAAVDDFIKALEHIAKTASPDDVSIPSLMDSSVGVQPIRYIFGRVKDYMQANSSGSMQSSKFALILPPSALTRTVDTMMRVFPFLKTRLFNPGERDKAIQWLLE